MILKSGPSETTPIKTVIVAPDLLNAVDYILLTNRTRNDSAQYAKKFGGQNCD